MQTDDSNPSVAFRLITANNSESDAFVGIESHSLSTIDPGFGTGIEFSVGSGSLNSLKQLGSITGVYDDASNYSIEIKAYGPGLFYDAPAIAKFKGNNEIILGRGDPAIKIKDNRIESYGVSNSNLIFDADGAGYIDFYGIYQFPRSIGQAGQVLKVPTSGTVLEWGTGGGGATTTAITAITLTNPLRITTGTAHGLTDNQNVTTTDIVGTTELNGNSYYVDVINSTTVDLYTDEALSTAVDGTTGFTAYTSGGYITGAAGAGGGSFVALSDTPNSYLAAAGDADKLVQVNGTGNGLIFTDPNALISATYIENKGFLPKAGGTMSGNLNVGGNITLNPSNGRIDATTVYGTFYGFLNGNANGNHTGTYNGPIGGVTPNTIVGTTITANTGFVGNLTGDTTGTHSGNVNGNVTGNLQGNVTGNVVGILNGNVTATSGSSSFNIINSGSINATGQITANSFSGNLTSTGTSNFNIVDVSGNIYNSVGNVLVNDNLDVTGNVAVTGNVSATGTLDVTGRGQIADLRIEGSSIENDNSNGGVRIAANGTGFIELQGNVRLNGPIAYSNNSDQIIGTTQTPATISANTTVSFITTQNWTSASAGLAYANLADGTYEGHIKILKMVSRGTYSIDGGVQNFDRYLQVNLKINGASSTVNLSENSEFGALTLIWHGGSWWILSQFDS